MRAALALLAITLLAACGGTDDGSNGGGQGGNDPSLILVGLALLQGLSLLCVFCSSRLGAGLSRVVGPNRLPSRQAAPDSS